MKELPKIGAHVHYRSSRGDREITGIVTAHYPGFTDRHEDTGERYTVADSVCVRIDSTPEWWPYNDDLFAPDVSEVEVIS